VAFRSWIRHHGNGGPFGDVGRPEYRAQLEPRLSHTQLLDRCTCCCCCWVPGAMHDVLLLLLLSHLVRSTAVAHACTAFDFGLGVV
jgi:hypothetical protein